MSVTKFDKGRFGAKVAARSRKLISPAEVEFESLTKQLGQELEIYTKSRSKTMSLTMAVFKTNLWNKTHTNFADFLMDTFKIQKSYAYLLIKSAQIAEENPDKTISNERQARAFSTEEKNGHVEPEKSSPKQEPNPRTITDKNSTNGGIQNSIKSGSKPTSKEVTVELDKIGTPIPLDALPYWNRQQEVQDILSQISKLKMKVVKARESEDRLWMQVDNFVEERFNQVHSVISQAKPFTVCTVCMGVPTMQPEGCTFCHSTGLIPKYKWDNLTPKEFKEIRMKSNIEYAKKHNLNMPVAE